MMCFNTSLSAVSYKHACFNNLISSTRLSMAVSQPEGNDVVWFRSQTHRRLKIGKHYLKKKKPRFALIFILGTILVHFPLPPALRIVKTK